MIEVDQVIHAPVRLRVMVALSELPDGATMSFGRLQTLLDLTAGNLITHVRKLVDAGYVLGGKDSGQTHYALTPTGREAFVSYRAALRELLG